MSGPLFSATWYRVAALTPRIRNHARFHRHRYWGETWYVLRDLASDRVYRFSPAGYFVVGYMDGRRTVQEIWEAAAGQLGDEAPTQDEFIQLLGQLHGADVLQCDVPPDIQELLDRHLRQERRARISPWLSPFSWRFPLLDPERLLTALLPAVRPLMGIGGGLLWLVTVGAGVLLAAMHWGDLTRDVLDRLFATRSLLLLWVLFPCLKTLHEFGHALTIKALGGEVHDLGLMLLVFTPVPYVDASGTAAFVSKWHRIAVGAAGMAVELFVAALAILVWVAVEPGMVRTLAYHAILMAGVTTLLFNANPLLRYDGYYILADLIEIPNLYTRARTYVSFLAERYLFGQREAEFPPALAAERGILAVYAVASAAYRVLVVVGIGFFLMNRFFYLGLALTAGAAVSWGIVPLVKGVRFLASSPRLRRVRLRANMVTLLLVVVLGGLLGLVPVPFRTVTEGVVWVPEEAFVRADTEGFVVRVVAQPGSRVRTGERILELRDPALSARAVVLEARLRELQARLDEQRTADRVKAEMFRDEIRYVREQLARVRQRLDALLVTSRGEGTFVLSGPASDLPGRFVRQGELLAFVVDLETLTIRTVVPQVDVDLVRRGLATVEVRLAERLDAPLTASIRREVPGGAARLPSPVLGLEGGGTLAVDPRDTRGMTTVQRVFQVDLTLPAPAPLINLGGRVYVRFDHGWTPLLAQWYRQMRQLFLARLNV